MLLFEVCHSLNCESVLKPMKISEGKDFAHFHGETVTLFSSSIKKYPIRKQIQKNFLWGTLVLISSCTFSLLRSLGSTWRACPWLAARAPVSGCGATVGGGPMVSVRHWAPLCGSECGALCGGQCGDAKWGPSISICSALQGRRRAQGPASAHFLLLCQSSSVSPLPPGGGLQLPSPPALTSQCL